MFKRIKQWSKNRKQSKEVERLSSPLDKLDKLTISEHFYDAGFADGFAKGYDAGIKLAKEQAAKSLLEALKPKK